MKSNDYMEMANYLQNKWSNPVLYIMIIINIYTLFIFARKRQNISIKYVIFSLLCFGMGYLVYYKGNIILQDNYKYIYIISIILQILPLIVFNKIRRTR